MFLFSCVSFPEEKDENYDHAFDHLIQEGDIVFRLGYGVVSYFIDKKMDPNEHISHVGMIVKENNEWQVVHSIPGDENRPDGTQMVSYKQFVIESKINTIQILRPNYSYFDYSKTCHYLKNQINKKSPFDLEFDIKDSSEIYCIELIWNALYKGNPEMKIDEIKGKDFCEILSYNNMTLVDLDQ